MDVRVTGLAASHKFGLAGGGVTEGASERRGTITGPNR